MPILTAALAPSGALVEVLIGLSTTSIRALRAALRPIPPPISVHALIDTGAEVTGVDSGLLQTLALPQRNFVLANLPAHGGLAISHWHDAGVTIVHPSGKRQDNLVMRSLAVLALPLAALGYQAVIGRDVLARCHFLYSGPRNRFRLSY